VTVFGRVNHLSAEPGPLSLSARYLKNCLTKFDQTWQAYITVNTHCVTTTQMQKVNGKATLYTLLAPRAIQPEPTLWGRLEGIPGELAE